MDDDSLWGIGESAIKTTAHSPTKSGDVYNERKEFEHTALKTDSANSFLNSELSLLTSRPNSPNNTIRRLQFNDAADIDDYEKSKRKSKSKRKRTRSVSKIKINMTSNEVFTSRSKSESKRTGLNHQASIPLSELIFDVTSITKSLQKSKGMGNQMNEDEDLKVKVESPKFPELEQFYNIGIQTSQPPSPSCSTFNNIIPTTNIQTIIQNKTVSSLSPNSKEWIEGRFNRFTSQMDQIIQQLNLLSSAITQPQSSVQIQQKNIHQDQNLDNIPPTATLINEFQCSKTETPRNSHATSEMELPEESLIPKQSNQNDLSISTSEFQGFLTGSNKPISINQKSLQQISYLFQDSDDEESKENRNNANINKSTSNLLAPPKSGVLNRKSALSAATPTPIDMEDDDELFDKIIKSKNAATKKQFRPPFRQKNKKEAQNNVLHPKKNIIRNAPYNSTKIGNTPIPSVNNRKESSFLFSGQNRKSNVQFKKETVSKQNKNKDEDDDFLNECLAILDEESKIKHLSEQQNSDANSEHFTQKSYRKEKRTFSKMSGNEEYSQSNTRKKPKLVKSVQHTNANDTVNAPQVIYEEFFTKFLEEIRKNEFSEKMNLKDLYAQNKVPTTDIKPFSFCQSVDYECECICENQLCQICNNSKRLNWKRIHQLFKQAINSNCQEFSEEWSKNCFRHAIWKLSNYDSKFNHSFLTLANIIHQMDKRYTIEFVQGKRSFFQKSIENDIPISSHSILVIANIKKPSSDTFEIEISDGAYILQTPPISNNKQMITNESNLFHLINTGKLFKGLKIHSVNAQLVSNHKNQNEIETSHFFLKSSQKYNLILNYNGISRAPALSKLGSQSNPFFRKTISSMSQASLQISMIDVIILKKYPIYYVYSETGKMGKNIYRSQLSHDFAMEYASDQITKIQEQDNISESSKKKQIDQVKDKFFCQVQLCFMVKAVDAKEFEMKNGKHKSIFENQEQNRAKGVVYVTFYNSNLDAYDNVTEGKRFRVYNLTPAKIPISAKGPCKSVFGNLRKSSSPKKYFLEPILYLIANSSTRIEKTKDSDSSLSKYVEKLKQHPISLDGFLKKYVKFIEKLTQKSKESKSSSKLQLNNIIVEDYKSRNLLIIAGIALMISYSKVSEQRLVQRVFLLTSNSNLVLLTIHDAHFLKPDYVKEKEIVYIENGLFQYFGKFKPSETAAEFSVSPFDSISTLQLSSEINTSFETLDVHFLNFETTNQSFITKKHDLKYQIETNKLIELLKKEDFLRSLSKISATILGEERKSTEKKKESAKAHPKRNPKNFRLRKK